MAQRRDREGGMASLDLHDGDRMIAGLFTDRDLLQPGAGLAAARLLRVRLTASGRERPGNARRPRGAPGAWAPRAHLARRQRAGRRWSLRARPAKREGRANRRVLSFGTIMSRLEPRHAGRDGPGLVARPCRCLDRGDLLRAAARCSGGYASTEPRFALLGSRCEPGRTLMRMHPASAGMLRFGRRWEPSGCALPRAMSRPRRAPCRRRGSSPISKSRPANHDRLLVRRSARRSSRTATPARSRETRSRAVARLQQVAGLRWRVRAMPEEVGRGRLSHEQRGDGPGQPASLWRRQARGRRRSASRQGEPGATVDLPSISGPDRPHGRERPLSTWSEPVSHLGRDRGRLPDASPEAHAAASLPGDSCPFACSPGGGRRRQGSRRVRPADRAPVRRR